MRNVLVVLMVTVGCGKGDKPSDAPNADAQLFSKTRLAVLGDTAGQGYEDSLALIKRENADIFLHLGDFDYQGDPEWFFERLHVTLGDDFPLLAAVGNHDVFAWHDQLTTPDGPDGYAPRLAKHMERANISILESQVDETDGMYAAVFNGIHIVIIGHKGLAREADYVAFLKKHLAAAPAGRRICMWHKNQNAMQTGEKVDEMGWPVYETCREYGALIVTGHEHVYARTHTLTSMSEQTVDISCADKAQSCLGPGRTVAIVSGLGGRSIRSMKRCESGDEPYQHPYGCKGEWAHVVAGNTEPKATDAVLFLDYEPDQPIKGYLKGTNDEMLDSFTLTID